ncbi:MAG: TM1266 family iron-only hydrogenase system putative regulator [Eubacteriales bacterium]|nr:CopG family transcriptional regulator [Christensenellaceae bacterium]MDD7092339.1 CopG family transcriptional regulator [Christensenellaceae bacterium]MDD7246088.1 CopG family transcriptional regulator [Christensenellaceae bacterium]MDY2751102.1 TM1266 family iron-only hydrogenase system putative regulator [Eubacteriales bacterium]MDY3240938.1 TM1266 family iron-only hydrogenase system putative regulator [Eubacteriales bacterium]
MKRIGVIGIVVENRSVVSDVQNLLSEFSEIILGRMGIPDRESGISAISLIIKGSVEEISALTGKLGKIRNISVKSALTGVDLK